MIFEPFKKEILVDKNCFRIFSFYSDIEQFKITIRDVAKKKKTKTVQLFFSFL